MCNLDDDGGRGGQQLLEERPRLPCAVRTLPVDASMQMNGDRHPRGIRAREDSLHLRDMRGVVQLHVRIAEVQLQSGPQR